MPLPPLLAATAVFSGVVLTATIAAAQPSTARGQISVAQVRAMLDQAPTNPTARQVLTAYLGGAGETAGWLLDAAHDRGAPPCARRLTLDAQQARDAIAGAAGTAATETPATPLIIRDMLKRAGCRLTE
ncbi:chlorophyllide reductase [Bradyrhizobium sp. WSM 1704]|uniref:chlorophyllide reductase n=1 Tax=Bradyrhizobium semiaridum TaxID=2821404 RepID=UPI001CE25A78|nr:chlorophyllide reductase [Bradyrhizobium semiaridum]MCA6124857.1 chlorophyllide reductase [Bradyrhizobium semiaridum]